MNEISIAFFGCGRRFNALREIFHHDRDEDVCTFCYNEEAGVAVIDGKEVLLEDYQLRRIFPDIELS